MRVCFVILHYLTDEDTIECINSINKLTTEEVELIIIDNFSNNGSIEKVVASTAHMKNCHIIYNQKNLGFAQGNNIGYEYVRRNFPSSFVVVINNDTVIKQRDFIKALRRSYNSNPFHVLGPDIISLIDGGHQNPMEKLLTKKDISREIYRYSALLLLSRIGLYDFIKKLHSKEILTGKINMSKGSYEVIHHKALHGSCLIFSPKFVDQVEQAFLPDTFLYMEEMILAKFCITNGMRMIYDPSLEIYHKEDSSTNMQVSSAKAKREFIFKNLIKSGKVYKRLFKKAERILV
ncbi:glycosyltransferase [Desulfosporosinus sp. FKA]|uniref:glycosyltransferase n=1 Tax=Desulfosporosinus sp. FKA TaxID=1969834 RepID=UPI0015535204|nr:glycosyltransferase [Desulfosporosinus sp. FKA]